MREYFEVPVYVNNDVNNILQYDVAVNHLENQKIVVGIYIGTGVGSSVIIDGKPLEGKDGAELDLGHIPYYKGNDPCSCGKKGCCECYASAGGFSRFGNSIIRIRKFRTCSHFTGRSSPLRNLWMPVRMCTL